MAIQTVMKEIPGDAIRIEYEPEVDILTIYLRERETALAYSSETEPGVILNYAEGNGLSSVEILDASKRYPASQLAALSVDEWMDLNTASKLSAIAAVTLRTQAERGKLWALRLSGHWVTTRARLQQYVDSRSRKVRL